MLCAHRDFYHALANDRKLLRPNSGHCEMTALGFPHGESDSQFVGCGALAIARNLGFPPWQEMSPKAHPWAARGLQMRSKCKKKKDKTL
jgi:hypothetical protein